MSGMKTIDEILDEWYPTIPDEEHNGLYARDKVKLIAQEFADQFCQPAVSSLWGVFDSGGQGMKDNGLIAVFTSEKAAKDFVGTRWLSIVPFISDVPYPNGVQYAKGI